MAHENFYEKNQPFSTFNFYVQIYSTEVFFFKLMKAFMCFFKQYFHCLVEIFETICILIKIPIQWGHKAKWIN